MCLLAAISCNGKINKEEAAGTPVNDRSVTAENPGIIEGARRMNEYLPLLNGRVGIVANQTSVVFHDNGRSYTHLVDTLISQKIDVVRVFAPEHGFRGTADAGELIEDGMDKKTGLPIISLYGKNKKPAFNEHDIDVVLFDIQDVGARFYTYISTLHYVMEACAEQGIPLIVLDRPNPNGHMIDGPVLDLKHKSFVGMHPIPVAHGMTIGEYAKMINGEGWLDNKVECDLKVVPIEHYTRLTQYEVRIKPSPNLPNDVAINLYPSLCFFEGTSVSAGRGTDMQFQLFGSPDLDPEKFIFRFTPQPNEGSKYPKHQDEECYGTDLRNENRLDKINLEWLIEAYQGSQNKKGFFNDFFVKLAGTTELQKQIVTGLSAEVIRSSWQEDIKAFIKLRQPYLLYD